MKGTTIRTGSACYLTALGLVNALGRGKAEVAARLFAGDTSGLVLEAGWLPQRAARVGAVASELPRVPSAWAHDDSRNHRLLLAALEEIRVEVDAAIDRYGRDRIGVILGTSTSGIAEGEKAVEYRAAHGAWPDGYHYRQQEIGRAAPFLAEYLGLHGPALTVSTACTASGRALASARNFLAAGLCDAVIVGGVDSLCRLTVGGFTALESTSDALMNPMSRNRRGINVGEGAALFIVSRDPPEGVAIALMGIGESSDAHHISAPDPTASGAIAAMRQALADAQTAPIEVAYVNLHATATPKNDEMESRAMAEVFSGGVACSGTKPLTGHTLGAAAATELAFCWLSLNDEWNPQRRVPPHRWDFERDPALPALRLAGDDDRLPARALQRVMSNSFAFGGSNVSVILGVES
jgi:3-oxoacyl-[acyl-carrier-protein] synthase-1